MKFRAGRRFAAALLACGCIVSGTAMASAEDDAVLQASNAYQTGNYHDAAALFRKALEINPRNALSWHYYGLSLQQDKDLAGAKSAYEQGLKLQSSGDVAEETRKHLAQVNQALELERQAAAKAEEARRARIEALVKAANGGDIKAMSDLAARYDTGNEVPADPAQARYWRDQIVAQEAKNAAEDRRQAAADDPDAMRRLAERYDVGKGVARDPAAAQSWREKAKEADARLAAKRREERIAEARKQFKFFPLVSELSNLDGPSGATTSTVALPFMLVLDVISLPFKTSDYAKIGDEAAYDPARWAKPDSMIARAAEFRVAAGEGVEEGRSGR